MFLQADRFGIGEHVGHGIFEDAQVVSDINKLATIANKKLSKNRLGPKINCFESSFLLEMNLVSCNAFEI